MYELWASGSFEKGLSFTKTERESIKIADMEIMGGLLVEDRRVRVLIADNNRDLCSTLTEIIDGQGDMQVVETVADGAAALAALRRVATDVVILDVAMPRLDGIAVLERLHELELDPIPRIIVLSALGRDDLMHQLTNLGADYYMVKPIDMEVLVNRIRQYGGMLGGDRQPAAQKPAIPASGSEQRSAAEEQAKQSKLSRELQVTDLLHRLGIPAHMKGYLYIRDAVQHHTVRRRLR
jgi:two-component system response regulator (stage 0 sporulation protein A)